MTSMAGPLRRELQPRNWLDELTSPAGLLLSAIVVLSLVPVTSVIRDPDFWWHLRAGQLILQHGVLLGTDPFTYTVTAHHWTMHEWLTEVLYALMVQAGGLGLVVLTLSGVTWIGLLFILQRARIQNPRTMILALGLLVAVVAGYPIWGPRVQMVTFCFSAITLFLVDRHLTRGGRAIWLLVPLFVLWSNLHSGFIVGLGFIAVMLLAEIAGRRLGMPDPAPAQRLSALGLVLLCCAAVSMINPNGPAILVYAFQTQTSAAQQALILEWHSPDFHDWVVWPFGIMLVSLAVMIARNRRIRARDSALVIMTTALALQSVRHIALFVAATTPVWIEQASAFVAGVRARRATRQRPLPPRGFRIIVLGTLMAALTGAYSGFRLLTAMSVQPNSLAYAQEFPLCASRWLASAPQPLRIFNQYGEGGFLLNQLSGRGDKVYIFGDAALMGDQLLYTYAQVEGVQPAWNSIIRDAGTDVVLFDVNTPLADVMQHSSLWIQVYKDPVSVAFVPADRYAQLHLPPQPTSYPAGDPCAQLRAGSLDTGVQNQ